MKNLIFFFVLLGSLVSMAQNRITVLRNPERSSGAYYVEQNIPSTLSPYLWLDASKPEYFSSNSNPNTTFICPNNNLGKTWLWLDKSGNNRHFSAFGGNNARPTYHCNTIEVPYYKSNAHITGDGVNDDLRYDFGANGGVINNDFTFVFVMKAENNAPTAYNSFMSSGTGSNVSHNWQISTTSLSSEFGFLLRGHPTRKIADYDTKPHVYILQRKTIGNQIFVIFKFDGVEIFSYQTNAAKAPTLSKLKLFRNRNEGTFIEASFYEFFVFTQTMTANEEYELSQYLLSKWGI